MDCLGSAPNSDPLCSLSASPIEPSGGRTPKLTCPARVSELRTPRTDFPGRVSCSVRFGAWTQTKRLRERGERSRRLVPLAAARAAVPHGDHDPRVVGVGPVVEGEGEVVAEEAADGKVHR